MKRALCILLTLCLLLTLAPAAFAAGGTDTQVQTSFCPENTLSLTVENHQMKIEGTLSTGFSGMFWLRIAVGSAVNFVSVTPGRAFSTSVSLSGVKETVPVTIHTCAAQYGSYRSYLWHSIYVEPDGDGYRFCSSPVLENNEAMTEGWLNPGAYLSEGIPDSVQAMSDNITQGANSDYEKVFVLYGWMTENLYYDYDAYNSGGQSLTAPEQVLSGRRGVCEGYTALLQAMIQAQGIPCIRTETYALGASTAGDWSGADAAVETANHLYVEAYVDGRWVVMDPVWDCNNRYENRTYLYRSPNCSLYFDPTPELLAGNHKTIARVSAAAEDIPSDWAQEEVLTAISADYVPAKLQGAYRTAITRQEFCTLILTMLCAQQGMTLDEFTQSRHATVDRSAFRDTSDPYVQAASALGIVNGRGGRIFDPDSGITRQEAAAMLTRAAKVMGAAAKGTPLTFADSDQFADWAVESITFVTALAGPSGTAVMAGTGNHRFSPLDTYTREQSILTVCRLADCL
ncbi:MAG: S-layer homology domain-containing protein [Oscillospiraceae bacterium]|nr:S-layer homology domain-containing protein [Oscillospiraceae bacterium]